MTPDPQSPDTRRSRRVDDLVAGLSLDEKLAQLVGVWLNVDREEGVVAPLQDTMQGEDVEFEAFARHGLGHVTRHFGTRPVDPEWAAARLAERQRWLMERTRPGIPALAHEECLTGLAAWRATTYPVPPAWGASFDPALVERMARRIGEDMAALGVHQGLAPVLDVIRDQRWGRVEECVSEDPYAVAAIGAAYVRGLQSAGVIATLKHFVGYSASRAGRNLAPVHAGPREVADTLLFPFEVAVRDAGAGSVMHSYAEIDGVPVAADPTYLTALLRDAWGFEGTVVADYFGVAFLHTLHAVADDAEDAAVQALTAGIDVELPTGVAYLEPLKAAVLAGRVSEDLVDRALRRVLTQKAALGLLDDDYKPEPSAPVDLDPPASREVARRLAEESVVLLVNDGVLPLGGAAGRRVALVGPNADSVTALFGCYAFVNHVLPQFPDVATGIEVPTLLDALRAELPDAEIAHERGTGVDDGDRTGIAAAARLAASSDVAILVLGDRSGLFGRGTSGEGCDVESLDLPGAQAELAEAVLTTGTPTVVVLLTGRAYAVPDLLGRAAAVVQAFFPGEAGAGAVARVLSGAVNPSGRLPMSMPRSAAGQPYSYLHPRLGAASSVSNIDPAPALPFGHGLSYTGFAYTGLTADETVPAGGGSIRCAVTVRNTGGRPGAEVVQVYASDTVASVTRPVAQLVGFARVELEPGQAARVGFDVPLRLLAFTGRHGRRVVEPGAVVVSVRRSAADVVAERPITITGPVYEVTGAERRLTDVSVHLLPRRSTAEEQS
ncbi:glycoside hydrolase family 3 N-terminal domain-containing protein [Nonomuraea sp. NPDC050691]|uniref:beta-xylosidase/alpha-l-arabinosidase n=1 Tax=Nonomuraea sp. NPDC050691 TaxID=3155661 RepID=UPI0033FB4B93